MKKLLIFAALTAASLSQPAVARPVEPRSAPVEYRDLNLQSREGVRTLERRLWRAVVEVCGTASDFDLEGDRDVRRCRNETRRLGAAQVDAVVANAAANRSIRLTSIQK